MKPSYSEWLIELFQKTDIREAIDSLQKKKSFTEFGTSKIQYKIRDLLEEGYAGKLSNKQLIKTIREL